MSTISSTHSSHFDKFFAEEVGYLEDLEGDSGDLLSGDVLESLDHVREDERFRVGEPFAGGFLEGEDPEVQEGVVDDLQVVDVLHDDVLEAV